VKQQLAMDEAMDLLRQEQADAAAATEAAVRG
jgi:hypothetical protein